MKHRRADDTTHTTHHSPHDTHAKGWSGGGNDASARTTDAKAGDTIKFTWSGGHNVNAMPDAASITGSCTLSGATATGITSPDTSPASFTVPSNAAIGDKFYFGAYI